MPDLVNFVEPEVTRTSKKSESDNENGEHDPHYEPIVSLPLVTISTNEENEVELCKIRARLYRFDTCQHEWKERGTGDVKLLHHPENKTVRVVMRRDKTWKLCANHFLAEDTQLNPHTGSDRAFNWIAAGDFADETAKQEFLAIKFGNVENANIWKKKFEEALDIIKSKPSTKSSSDGDAKKPESTSSIESKEDKSEIIKDADAEKTVEKKDDEIKDNVVTQLSELKLDNSKENDK